MQSNWDHVWRWLVIITLAGLLTLSNGMACELREWSNRIDAIEKQCDRIQAMLGPPRPAAIDAIEKPTTQPAATDFIMTADDGYDYVAQRWAIEEYIETLIPPIACPLCGKPALSEPKDRDHRKYVCGSSWTRGRHDDGRARDCVISDACVNGPILLNVTTTTQSEQEK